MSQLEQEAIKNAKNLPWLQKRLKAAAQCLDRSLVRHGGGDERFRLSGYRSATIDTILSLGDTECYWTLATIFHAMKRAASDAAETERRKWTKAAAEKRIKTRKCKDRVKVWIES